jgi:hypothetical protein
MDNVNDIGMDGRKEAASTAVLNVSGKVVMECTIETHTSIHCLLSHHGGMVRAIRRS